MKSTNFNPLEHFKKVIPSNISTFTFKTISMSQLKIVLHRMRSTTSSGRRRHINKTDKTSSKGIRTSDTKLSKLDDKDDDVPRETKDNQSYTDTEDDERDDELGRTAPG